MIDKINKGTGVEKREKEEKKKIQDQFGIASGILNTRNLLLAPITNVINQSDKVCSKKKQTKRVLANIYYSPQSKSSISLGGCSRYKTFPRYLS